jgi:hypothetical protein
MTSWQRSLIAAWEICRVLLMILAAILVVILLTAVASHLPPLRITSAALESTSEHRGARPFPHRELLTGRERRDKAVANHNLLHLAVSPLCRLSSIFAPPTGTAEPEPALAKAKATPTAIATNNPDHLRI